MAQVPGDEQMSQQELAYLQKLLGLGQQGTQVNTVTPLGSQVWSTDANGNRTLTTQYDPSISADLAGQLGTRNTQRSLFGTAANGLSGVLANGFNTGNVNAPGVTFGTTPSTLMTGFDRSSFQAIPGADDFQGNQQSVEDALYGRSTARLDPQFTQSQAALETQLRNQGFQPGDQGYDDAMANFNNAKNDAYAGARNYAIAGGQQTASNLLADALRIRGAQDTEGQQDYSNYNTAAGTNYAQRAGTAAASNAGRQQAVGESALDYTLPLQGYSALSGMLPQGSMLPNFGSGTTSLAQPTAPSFTQMTQLGASNQQANDNRNAQIGSAVAGGVGSIISNPNFSDFLGGLFSSSPDLSMMPFLGDPGSIADIPDIDWGSLIGF